MKQSVPKTTFFIILLTTSIIGFLVFLKTNSAKIPNPASLIITNQNAQINTYTSKNLKISFQYPQDWYIDEKDLEIMITSFKTKIGENKLPNNEEFKLFFSLTSLCQESIEKNLIYGGCGENQKILNVILKKDIQTLPSGNTLYKFLVRYPDKSETWSYYLEKGKRLLQISKTPDPSQFEKEFEDLVNSIRFID